MAKNISKAVTYIVEADTTIPSEYILLMHFLGKIEIKLQDKIVNIF